MGGSFLTAGFWRTRAALLSWRAADVSMLVLGVLGAAAILWFGRGWDLFFFDEWGTILYRREGGLDAFLAPSNGHLQAVVIAIYRVLFATAGLEHFLPYRLTMLAAHCGLVVLVYLYARRRVQPEIAIVLSVLVLVMGTGWEVVFWPINLGYVFPPAALVGYLLLADREGRGAVAARTLLVAVAIASSALGLAVAAAVGVEAVLRRDRWRRILEPAVPVALWAAWYLLYRPGASTPAALREIPGAAPRGDSVPAEVNVPAVGDAFWGFVNLAQAGVNGLLGVDPGGAPWLVLVVGAAGLAAFVRRPPIRRRLITLTAAPLAYWLSIAIARGGFLSETVPSHYNYVSVVFLVLIAAECLSGIRLPRAAVPVIAAAAVVILVANVRTFDDIGHDAGNVFDTHRVKLRLLNDPALPPEFAPDPHGIPWVNSGTYREATKDLGYPAGTAP